MSDILCIAWLDLVYTLNYWQMIDVGQPMVFHNLDTSGFAVQLGLGRVRMIEIRSCDSLNLFFGNCGVLLPSHMPLFDHLLIFSYLLFFSARAETKPE